MNEEEYDALDKQLIELYVAAMNGDKKDIQQLYQFADMLLRGKQEVSTIRSKSGTQKGKADARKIWTLAIKIRRRLIKEQEEDEFNEVAEPEWNEIVEEVISEAKKNGITTKRRTIVDVLNKNRNFIEKIDLYPHRSA